MADIRNVAVIGAGTMGNGIAHVFALNGYQVSLVEIDADQAARAMEMINRNLDRQVGKGEVERGDRDAAIARIQVSTDLQSASEAGLIVEAVSENRELKFDLFRQLERLTWPDAILASNTSSISITEIARNVNRPARVVGMHFMNPVPVMKLVELIRGFETSDETAQAVRGVAERLGKIVAEARDYPGFVSNRVLMPMINEAVYCLMEGVADRESIDAVMKLGMHHPLGPLALADMIGLDTCLAIMEVLQRGLGDDKYRPCPLLRQYVAAGRLGRKTGAGFYTYREEDAEE